MPTEESKQVQPDAKPPAFADDAPTSKALDKQPAAESENEVASEPEEEGTETSKLAGPSSEAKKGKKKSKRKTIKDALTGQAKDGKSGTKQALGKLPPEEIRELLALNPALEEEIAAGSLSNEDLADKLKRLNLQDIMTGLASSGKNVKDMASYKFWQTQPVPRFDETGKKAEGPLKEPKVEDVPTEPQPMIDGFEWVTVDPTDDVELKEIHELLRNHYVEDNESTLRFNYSLGILRWAMLPPGWRKELHVGVRASASKKLVAFISGIPLRVRIRDKFIVASDVNFLVVHKKLRGKRLAPVLIKEITRRSNLGGIWQGLYTGGIVLPTPISTCRYFHRSINWQKLYEVGFSPLPPGSKPQYQIRKYALPDNTSIKGLRKMEAKDADAVRELLNRYLERFELVPEYTKEEFEHWFPLTVKANDEQFLWCYVVEDEKKKITDFFSFYSLESSVINNTKHDAVQVAYLYYYATETGIAKPTDKSALRDRLNALVSDALILAKRFKFDVFNALSLMDNALFLEQQKFGPGDGYLHYYLFNYRLNPVSGGVDKKGKLDADHLSGVGVVIL